MDRNKIIIFSVIGFVVIAVVAVIIFNPFKEAKPTPVTLEFWSVFDDSDIYRPLIAKFQERYPHITINYHKKNITSYEQELVDALAAGRGPDIFSIHNTWLPKHKDKLAPAPENLITPKRFNEVFVDVATQDFVDGGKVYAFPLAVDTLALFYNKDLLNSAGISSPPQTWTEFNSAVEKLTRRDNKNNILQSGAALGTAKNINRSTDILMVLMLQSGAKMVSDDKSVAAFDQTISTSGGEVFNPGRQALIYYANFASPITKVYTWNQNQHYSLDAFVEGKTAMILNYAYQIPVLRARAPHLNFDVAALPQISKTSRQITFANYWAQAVAKNSQNQAAAWQFIAWLSGADNSKNYLETAKKPAARRDLIDGQKNDADLGVFAKQSLIAKSWWEIDNLAIEKIFADMIESVVSARATTDDALRSAAQQVNLLIRGE
jgi:multiple sugar transport system substrate-binding protein